MTLFDSFRPFLSRWIGSLVGVGAAWLLAKYGLNLDEHTRSDVTEMLVLLITTLIVRDTTHREVSKKVNPADSASKHLAVAGKQEVADMKTAERQVP